MPLSCMHAMSLLSCPTLRDPMDCSLPGSSARGIFLPIVYCDCCLSFMVFMVDFFLLCWLLDYELIFGKTLFIELGNGPG